jgi:hypothetical protein
LLLRIACLQAWTITELCKGNLPDLFYDCQSLLRRLQCWLALSSAEGSPHDRVGAESVFGIGVFNQVIVVSYIIFL